jgi:hypothetical protein
MVIDDNDTWDEKTIMTWDYEGSNVIFARQWRRRISCGYCLVIKGLVIQGNSNDLCVNIKHVVDKEQMFIAWDYMCIWRHICLRCHEYVYESVVQGHPQGISCFQHTWVL